MFQVLPANVNERKVLDTQKDRLIEKGGRCIVTDNGYAVHLAVAAEKAGHTTALIDLDPQASAVKWSNRREDDSPVVISVHSTLLDQVLETAEENGVSLCILDTSPHSESAALDAAIESLGGGE